MPSAFDNKVICLIVTTATFAILKLSMIIKHQKTLGKTKKNEKTIFQESQKPWNKEQNLGKNKTEQKKWRFLGGPSISQNFRILFFLVLPGFFVLYCFGQKPWRNTKNKNQLETLGWTLYLPRLLVYFVFSKFFLCWSLSAMQEKHTSRLFGGGGSPDSQNIFFFMFFPRFLVFARSTGFAGTNCHTLLAGPQAIYSSYKRFKRCYSTTPFGLPDSQGPIVILCYLDRKLFQLCGRL